MDVWQAENQNCFFFLQKILTQNDHDNLKWCLKKFLRYSLPLLKKSVVFMFMVRTRVLCLQMFGNNWLCACNLIVWMAREKKTARVEKEETDTHSLTYTFTCLSELIQLRRETLHTHTHTLNARFDMRRVVNTNKRIKSQVYETQIVWSRRVCVFVSSMYICCLVSCRFELYGETCIIHRRTHTLAKRMQIYTSTSDAHMQTSADNTFIAPRTEKSCIEFGWFVTRSSCQAQAGRYAV